MDVVKMFAERAAPLLIDANAIMNITDIVRVTELLVFTFAQVAHTLRDDDAAQAFESLSIEHIRNRGLKLLDVWLQTLLCYSLNLFLFSCYRCIIPTALHAM
jgi:hypothetical protein